MAGESVPTWGDQLVGAGWRQPLRRLAGVPAPPWPPLPGAVVASRPKLRRRLGMTIGLKDIVRIDAVQIERDAALDEWAATGSTY